MGKLRKGRKNQRGRLNPVAKKMGSNASKQEIKDETLRQNKIVPLIGKLSSSAPNDRSVALSAITVLAEDERMRKILLKERLVPTVMEQTLNDSNEELVVESFGLLRNLTIEEGYEVAKFLWRSNIWASIESGLTKIENSLKFMQSEPKGIDKKITHMLFDFIENVLSLIVLIASCSDDLYESIYSKIGRVVNLVIDALNWNIAKLRTVKLFNSLLDFIYEFASDSAEFITSLADMPSFSLPKLLEAVQLPAHKNNNLGKIYVQGIYFHFLEVKGDETTTKDNACAHLLKATFDTVTSIDINNVKTCLSTADNAHEPIQKPKPDEKLEDIDVPFGGESAEKINARSDLQAIDISIDLFTSICEYLALNESEIQEQTSLNESLINLFLDVAHPSYMHLLTFDQENDEILQLTSKLLIAYNNMCWLFLSMDAIPTAWYSKIPELWEAAEKVAKTENLEYQRLTLNIFWALTKSVGPEVKDKVSLEDVKGLLTKCNLLTSSMGEAKELDLSSLEYVLSAIGFLGSIAQVIGNTEITSEVSQLLVVLIRHFAASQNNMKEAKAIEIPIECLNLLYDIFGDASYEYDLPVFVQQNYLQKLEELEPIVKSCYKHIDKNKNPELKLRAEEAWTNLGRFIQYKKSERQ
ncbi:hypothetical protein METBIDRAFT_209872 [Metschnikowia bicuspidata var. bicuspidata NRRL YB-4993]|uniref:SYO1-like TPR repeats domain-containing protein n=1 Tax=Metschnikowia bicuspidata var. bicuspidata NRRL YB-4993 TaxID=869754 RepID=A0A1A0H7P3_9ASCO|nr:hypothetical protein METBIDRAFT_209872 [Metschnikowia bicuspidata var. bicuspidata NRRL YB-4993]OBA19912.1 hypothetical protein METBIDRAFT_209872 [Metschnikowia bicuspidata var. bicuspidata NRRL YB-4993]